MTNTTKTQTTKKRAPKLTKPTPSKFTPVAIKPLTGCAPVDTAGRLPWTVSVLNCILVKVAIANFACGIPRIVADFMANEPLNFQIVENLQYGQAVLFVNSNMKRARFVMRLQKELGGVVFESHDLHLRSTSSFDANTLGDLIAKSGWNVMNYPMFKVFYERAMEARVLACSQRDSRS